MPLKVRVLHVLHARDQPEGDDSDEHENRAGTHPSHGDLSVLDLWLAECWHAVGDGLDAGKGRRTGCE